MNNSPTVFLVITHGAHARLALRSPVLQLLKQAGMRLVILAPGPAVPHLQAEFEDGEGVWVRTVSAQLAKGAGKLEALRSLLLADWRQNETVALKKAMWSRQHPWQSRLFYLPNGLFSRFRPLDWLWLTLDRRLFPDHSNLAVFREFHPDLVVVFSLMHPEAVMAVRQAHQEGVPSLYVVESWDNLSGKGHFRESVERLVVWNNILRQEATLSLGYQSGDVYVAGTPFHDVYAHQDTYRGREEVLEEMGLDPARKTIFIAGTTDSVLAEFDDVLDMLLTAETDRRLAFPCQFLVRPHPQVYCGWDPGKGTEEDLQRYESLSPHLKCDRPRLVSTALKSETVPGDNRRLAELLYHSDVILNAFSTISIDAAAVDRPAVLIGFDGYASKDYYQSVLRYRDYAHQLNLVCTGGIRIAYSPQQLIEQVNAYLNDPSLDAAGRRRIREEQAWRLDGLAANRVAHAIAQYARGRWAPDAFTSEVAVLQTTEPLLAGSQGMRP